MDRYDAMLDEIRTAIEEDIAADARRFLVGLDPESDEGMWFDAVAESFPSRVDAAVAYLRSVKVPLR